MSRIGRAPIALPAGVTFDNTDNLITVKGPLGTLTQKVDSSIDVVLEDGHILVKRHSDDKDHRALHGPLPRAHPQHGDGRDQGLREEPRGRRRRL